MDAINTKSLTKFYPGQSKPAVNNLSISIKQGEIYGFLGANGAGKTTTIRLLMDFIKPTDGTIEIFGLDLKTNSIRIKEQIGYLAGEAKLYSGVSGKQILDFLSSIRQVDNSYRKKLEKDFQADLNQPIEELSKGNKQKIAIIQALMNQPKALILDEPTSGLDPLMQEVFYDTIEDLSKNGTAILMSSHNLSEAQKICHRIGIIKNGSLVHQQDVGEDSLLSANLYRLKLKFAKDIKALKKFNQLTLVKTLNDTEIIVKPKKSLNDFLGEISKLPLIEFNSQKIDLEDEFLTFYGENK